MDTVIKNNNVPFKLNYTKYHLKKKKKSKQSDYECGFERK